MTYKMKPLGCDPVRIKGMSERLIISHYENNYGGAVKRLNLIGEKLAELDYANAPGFLINGLKREELVAMNSMILHEHFFDSLGDQSEPDATLQEALARDFGSFERWHAEFIAMGKASAEVPVGCCCHGRRAIASSSISGPPTTATPWRAVRPSLRSICTSIPITSTTEPRLRLRRRLHDGNHWPAVRRAYDGVRRELPGVACPYANPRVAFVSCGWPVAYGQENVQIAGEKDIRARVIGKDMTDSSHWVSYFRSDGALLSNEWAGSGLEPGRSRTTNSACRTRIWSHPIATKSGCLARTYGYGRTRMKRLFDALLENHKAD